jgi:hypothetical protein
MRLIYLDWALPDGGVTPGNSPSISGFDSRPVRDAHMCAQSEPLYIDSRFATTLRFTGRANFLIRGELFTHRSMLCV